MCGLFGVYSTTITKSNMDDFYDLGTVSLTRGVDSSGVVTVRRGKKNKMHFDVMKEPTDFIGLLKTQANEKVLSNLNGRLCAMGHNRAATVGTITKDNAHPFICKNIIGMHNGTIRSLGDKDKTDSEQLFQNIQAKGLKNALDDIDGDAAYALVWVDTLRDTFHMIRNKERPLWVMVSQGGNTFLYASEKRMLDFVNMGSSTVWKKPEPLPEDMLFTWHLSNMKPTIKEVKREVKPSFAGFYHKPKDEIPFTPNLPVPVVGPHKQMPRMDEFEAQTRAPVFDKKSFNTETDKWDKAIDVFPQTPHGGYPHKISVTVPEGSHHRSQQKNLWFLDYYGIPQIPGVMKNRLDEGCLISRVRATLQDKVLWLDNGTYVMPWHRNDSFVTEYLAGAKVREGYAIYATIANVAAYRNARRQVPVVHKETGEVLVN